MTTQTTRVAMAGFGAWGQMEARALANIAGAEIVAVYCHGDASAEAVALLLPKVPEFRDYDAMLRAGGFDVVCVTSPNHLHAAHAVAAMEAGAHVFLEKPLGISLEECDAVIAASERTGRLVALDHELRVSKQWGAVRAMIAAGEIGRVGYQHFSLFRHKFRTGAGGWRYDPRMVGSWTLEELVHFFDLVLWNASEIGLPSRVRAFGTPRSDGLIENFSTVLEWDGGATAVLSQCLTGFEHHTMLEIAGDAGAIRTWWSGALDRTLHPTFELKVQRSGGEPETVDVPKSGEVFELEENLRCALAGFRDGVSILTPREARASIAVCLAAEEALRNQRVVELVW